MFTVVNEAGPRGPRTGILHTAHADVRTPAFMPVATKASVKTMSADDLLQLEVQNIISNAYLLHLRPGTEVIEAAGGLHRFMNWPKSIFSDSGGFQIVRDGFKPRVTEDGIILKSPFDGRQELITPALSSVMQEKIGSDVAMFLDDCAPLNSSEARVEKAVERTTRWAGEFSETHTRRDQMKFAIAQGGTSRIYREKSARELNDIECDGYGIGGLCLGESKEAMHSATRYQLEILHRDRPKYLMGVGTPVDIIRAVEMGVDIFDSVYPTRNARHRTALTRRGPLNINSSGFKGRLEKIEEGCDCSTCKSYSRAYLYHLFGVKELLAMRLLTVHNLHFMMRMMKDIRASIDNGVFDKYKKEFIETYCGGSEDHSEIIVQK